MLLGLFGGLFGAGSGKSKPKGGNPPAAKAPARPKLKKVNVGRRFTLIAETAQGSMSKVYKALDNDNGRSVCLKIQDKVKTDDALARTGHAAASRPSEGEIGKMIVHPNVCKTYEYGLTSKGDYFITMEFVEGVSLSALRASRALTLSEKLEFLAQAADGLAAVHAAKFIHHDIGPRNFLVDDRTGAVKLIDFGLAVPNSPMFNKPGNRTGTLNYMAPELVRREPTDERIDVFSFGAMAFEFLTGKLPYDGTTQLEQMRQRINLDPRDPASVAPHLPEAVCELLRKTLTRRREDRWPDMASLSERLKALAEEIGAGEPRRSRGSAEEWDMAMGG